MSTRHIDVWNKCIDIIKDILKPSEMEVWFKPVKPLFLDESNSSFPIMHIQVPTHFFYEFIEEQYAELIHKVLSKVVEKRVGLKYNVSVLQGGQDSNVSLPGVVKSEVKNRPVQIKVNAQDVKNPFTVPGIQKIDVPSNLNTRFSFFNFIEGDCNRLARSASFAVAQKPGGTAYNPLFLQGVSGLGKTHLAQSIGIYIKENMPQKLVVYVSAEQWGQQYVTALKRNEIGDFINFYMLMDVLIVDDVQFLSGKTKMQEVFFSIFNYLHSNGRQMVLTSDKPAKDLDGIEERLLSRFKWGLSAELKEPDVDVKCQILKSKASESGVELADDIIEYVAMNIDNVRVLEGAMLSLIAQSTLNKKDIDLALTKQMLKNFIKQSTKEITIESIQKSVCEYFDISVDLLKSKTRKREVVQARQISMYLAKSFTKSSLKTIGEYYGGRDHSTVIYACQTVQDLLETDKKFRGWVSDIQKKIQ